MNKKNRIAVRDLTRISLCTALIAICAWISFPLGDIPITLQTFGIFAALCLLGGKKGTVSILIYILLGIAGLPVFSGFRGGIGTLMGPTGGYIWGFLIAGLVFWAVEATGKQDYLPLTVFALILGNLLCYLFGSIWFQQVYLRSSKTIGLSAVFLKCVAPYILPDLVKLVAAVVLSRTVKKILSKQEKI